MNFLHQELKDYTKEHFIAKFTYKRFSIVLQKSVEEKNIKYHVFSFFIYAKWGLFGINKHTLL